MKPLQGRDICLFCPVPDAQDLDSAWNTGGSPHGSDDWIKKLIFRKEISSPGYLPKISPSTDAPPAGRRQVYHHSPALLAPQTSWLCFSSPVLSKQPTAQRVWGMGPGSWDHLLGLLWVCPSFCSKAPCKGPSLILERMSTPTTKESRHPFGGGGTELPTMGGCSSVSCGSCKVRKTFSPWEGHPEFQGVSLSLVETVWHNS